MATPIQIIQTLERRGVTLNLSGENLEVTGVSKLTDAEKTTLRKHKPALIRALERRCDNTASFTTCALCSHFQRDTIGDGSGLGRCTQGHGWYWPREWHVCQSWLEVGHG